MMRRSFDRHCDAQMRLGYRERDGTVGQRTDDLHVLTRRTLSLLADEPQLEREKLAKAVRGSPFALSRHFHNDTGTTLVQYRTRLRLLRMIRLFDEGERELKSAASAAGFGSYSQCHRVFRAELGCSPRAFFGSDLRERMQSAYAL